MSAPTITPDDLQAFHRQHFSSSAIDIFAGHFLGPSNPEEDEDDGLGYYDDGVKRTLTDEQIAMFRHSEIQTHLREQRHAEAAKAKESPSDDVVGNVDAAAEDSPAGDRHRQPAKKNRRKKGFFKEHVKPDLRKRTWDKVDTGLDTLDYGEETESASAPNIRPLRKPVSYEDD